jgi:hypothetical protein
MKTACFLLIFSASVEATTVWPLPADMKLTPGKHISVLPSPGFFSLAFNQTSAKIDVPKTLAAAFDRYLDLTFPHVVTKATVGDGDPRFAVTSMQVKVADLDESHPQLSTDESYDV